MRWRGAFTRIVPEGAITLRTVACPQGDTVGEYAQTLVGRLEPLAVTPVLEQVMREGQGLFLDNVPGLPRRAGERRAAPQPDPHRGPCLPQRLAAVGEMSAVLAHAPTTPWRGPVTCQVRVRR